MTKLLSNDDVTHALDSLDGWSGDPSGIERTVEMPSFPDAVALVVAVARAAEEADHHPDIDIRWRTVTFRLSTHSEGGVTNKDVDLATAIDRLTAAHG
jgi:4a-hydroxytetrahydrobiopterin dehydratase